MFVESNNVGGYTCILSGIDITVKVKTSLNKTYF